MKSAFGGLLIAVLLFAASALCWSQARAARRLAESHQRLATLHYDVNDESDGATTVLNWLPWPGGTIRDDVQRHWATVTYWLSRYESLTYMTGGTGDPAPTDPALLFVAANAAFRVSAPLSVDRSSAIERLDGVIHAYADVLRKDPAYVDAAFNYEFVSRLRDTLAKAPAGRAPRDPRAAPKQEDVSVDLPSGPTVHGRPGGPPEDTDMSNFKTITPMRSDERDEQVEPGGGRQIRRKG